MSTRFAVRGWAATAAASLALTLALFAGDVFGPLDRLLAEKYSAWSLHESASDIVIIGIDSTSIAALNRWPWPRKHHAAVLDAVREAGADRVFVDIDFSSPSTLHDDRALEDALSKWDRARVVLPYFVQSASAAGDAVLMTEPLPALARNSTAASVTLVPDADSRIRKLRSSWQLDSARIPAAFSVLAGSDLRQEWLPIDFGISPASFTYHSYVDVLRGHVDPEDLRGKTVLIGAVAVELGDMLPVPVHRSLPGVVIHALATQTARVGPVEPVPATSVITVLIAWTALLAWTMRRFGWQGNLGVVAAALLLILGAGFGAYRLRFSFDMVPFAFATIVCFVAATVLSLNIANLRSRLLGELAKSRGALLDSVLQTSYDGILTIDRAGNIESHNSAARLLLAGPHGELQGKPLREFLRALAASSGTEGLVAMNGRILEQTMTSLTGEQLPVEVSTTEAVVEGAKQYTLILRDLRERRRQEEQLQFQATHDALTGLPNRVFLARELERRLGCADARPFWVLLLDLTRFKEVNDTLGHDVGDLVLRSAGSRFDATVNGRGLLARMGGDEFVVLADCDASRKQLDELLADICATLREPIVFEGLSIAVGVSIGVAGFPADGTDATTLLKNADIAMYSAKRLAEDFTFYAPELNQHSVRRLGLLGELRAAIEQDQLRLNFQPQVSLRTGRTEGVEALLRWNHPKFGSVSPGEVIPLVENTDLLRPLTDWCISTALRQQREWARQGINVRMAVNLSARLLQDLAFPERLAQLLLQHDVPPEWLELEITESAMMIDVERALTVGRLIREQGVQLSIDDYGTGYSSLSYLRALSVGTLKLDRMFVEDLENSPDNRAIVASTLALAHALNLVVIAEGVATPWQAEYLRGVGYDIGQGYHFARPMDAEACLQWMRERDRASESPVLAHRRSSAA